jgi:peptidoglycan/LPS O-acetylase OafA/YrhL
MFRRPFRLYLPPIALTFTEMLATRLGVGPPLNFTFVAEPTLAGQVDDWLKETFHFINPIYNAPRALQGLITHPKYDAVIWTIPLEFYGSLVCYLLLLVMARISLFGGNYSTRTAVLIVLALCSMYLGSWNNFCFLAGMLIADFNLWQEEKGASLDLVCNNKVERHNSKDWIWWSMFAAAFYVAGLPTLMNDEARKNPMPGYEILRALIPTSLKMEDHARFWWSISGV